MNANEARSIDLAALASSDEVEANADGRVAREIARYRALSRRVALFANDVDETSIALDDLARSLTRTLVAIANGEEDRVESLRDIALDLSTWADALDDAFRARSGAIANRDDALADALSLAAYVGLADISIERVAIDDAKRVASALASIEDAIARRY